MLQAATRADVGYASAFRSRSGCIGRRVELAMRHVLFIDLRDDLLKPVATRPVNEVVLRSVR